MPLRDIATQCAQSWADELAEHDRPLTAAVEGDIETTYTPGPVEQILDLLLLDVLHRSDGAVRMEFDADVEGHLRIRVKCATESRARGRAKTHADAVKIMAAKAGVNPKIYEKSMGGTAFLDLKGNLMHYMKGDGLDSVYGSSKIANDFYIKYGVYKDAQDPKAYYDPSLVEEISGKKVEAGMMKKK